MSKTTFDLSTLDLAVGSHTVKVKAKADGYDESEFSNEVSYTKEAGVIDLNVKPEMRDYTVAAGGGDYSAESKITFDDNSYIVVKNASSSTGESTITYYNSEGVQIGDRIKSPYIPYKTLSEAFGISTITTSTVKALNMNFNYGAPAFELGGVRYTPSKLSPKIINGNDVNGQLKLFFRETAIIN